MLAFGHGEAFTLTRFAFLKDQTDDTEPESENDEGSGDDKREEEDTEAGDDNAPNKLGWDDTDCASEEEEGGEDDAENEDYGRDNTLIPVLMFKMDTVMMWGIPAEVRPDLIQLRTEFKSHMAKQHPAVQGFKRGRVGALVDAMDLYLQESGYSGFSMVRGHRYVHCGKTTYTAFLQYKAPHDVGPVALAVFGISRKRGDRAFVLHRTMSEVMLCLGALPDLDQVVGHVFPMLVLISGTRVDVSACIYGHEAFCAGTELSVLLRTQLGAMPLPEFGGALQFICEYSQRALLPLVRRHFAGEARMHAEDIVVYTPNSCFRVGESFIKFLCHNNDPKLRADALERARCEIAGWRIVHSTEISCWELDVGAFMLKMPSLVEPNQRDTGRGRHIEGEPWLAYQDLWRLEARGLQHCGASPSHIVNGRIISFSHLKPIEGGGEGEIK